MEEQKQHYSLDPLIDYQSMTEKNEGNIIRKEEQNTQNCIININDDCLQQQKYQKNIVRYVLIIAAFIVAIIYLPKWCIAAIVISAAIFKAGCYLFWQLSSKQQSRPDTLQDWERMFGLDNFKEINDQPYTKEDLDCVFKQKKIFWNPNKKKEDSKKQIAIKRLQQCEKAYQNILKHHNWN
ncbi:hypothetical protein ABPG72_006737 [Tetrahymena utriculariae]